MEGGATLCCINQENESDSVATYQSNRYHEACLPYLNRAMPDSMQLLSGLVLCIQDKLDI